MTLTNDAINGIQDYIHRKKRLQKYYDYYNGEHNFDNWADKIKKNHYWAIRDSITNYCPAVVKGFTDGISVEAVYGVQSEAKANSISRELRSAIFDSWLAGDSFIVTVMNDDGEAFPIYQPANTMVPYVSETNPGVLDKVVKVWFDEVRWNIQVIYKEHIENFSGIGETKRDARGKKYPKLSDKENEWTRDEDTIHGFDELPVVWLKRDALSQYDDGVSILKDVIPAQDKLNKVVSDILIGSNSKVSPLRYMLDSDTAVADEITDSRLNINNGNFDTYEDNRRDSRAEIDINRDSMIYSSAKSAGEFSAADTTGLLEIKESYVKDISNIVGLEPWTILQTIPSNISLDTAKLFSGRITSNRKNYISDNRAAMNAVLVLLGYADDAEFIFTSDVEDIDAAASTAVDTDETV